MQISYVAVAASICIAISVASVARAATIETLSARYGTPETGRVCDATPAIANMCNGRVACDVSVGNTALCGDPDFLVTSRRWS